jgi:hypothetical protein
MLCGCAAGERFGSSDPGEGVTATDAVCQSNIDCYDGEPNTVDFCGPDGTCQNLWLIDTDTEIQKPNCDTFAVVAHDTEIDFDIDAVDGELTHAAPLSQGLVIKLSFRDPARIRIRPTGKDLHGVMLVLLNDCVNAAANRITWGPAVYSSELDGGDYYLAVFSDEARSLALDVHFLEVTDCDDADGLETGELTDTADGSADDFSGSCMPTGDLTSHRGDRIYSFTVPDGEIWDARIDLFTGDAEPNHYIYLRRGCAGPDMVEVDCANEFVVPDCSESLQEDYMRIRGEGLEPGDYYVIVDALPAESYSLGEYRLVIDFDGGLPR